MADNDFKVCRYCKSKFHKIDYPKSFYKMITCGNIECAGKRRRELWLKKYNMMKQNA